MATTHDGVEARNPDACEVVEAIEAIGSSWRLIVLHNLLEGEYRFNELKRATGASARTLSRVLEDLQGLGLVDRRVEDKPVSTHYSLTEKGQALRSVFAELESWATAWC